jgi:hypothetical protein
MGKNIYEDLDINPEQNKNMSSKPGLPNIKGFLPLIVIVIVILIAFTAVLSIKPQSGDKNQVAAGTDENDMEMVEAKSFSKRFLAKFYWYNQDSYVDVRRDAEKMMTSGFLEKYKKIYYDSEFENLVLDSSLIVRTTADRILYKKGAANYQVKITGFITYESTKSGAEINAPATWIMSLVKNENELQVDDLTILL